MDRLMSKRIPKPHSQIGKRRAGPDQIAALDRVESDKCRFWQQRPCQLQARAHFEKIRPCLPFLVERQVGVPVELRTKRLRPDGIAVSGLDRKSTRLNSSH